MSAPPQVVEWTPHDLLALQVLGPLLAEGGYLPWSSGAMRPSGLAAVCNEVVWAGRRRVVELGAGASTVLLARLLREQEDPGVRLDAIEHDAAWADWVNARLAREGLETLAHVTLAPLEPHPFGVDGLAWYATGAMETALEGDPIDLLVVDGPPAFDPGMGLARYPALPALAARLADDAVVVLDDVIRPGEAEVVTRWAAETAFSFERREREAIAVGRRPA
jgi:predicted O-methyltransferase YrrM